MILTPTTPARDGRDLGAADASSETHGSRSIGPLPRKRRRARRARQFRHRRGRQGRILWRRAMDATFLTLPAHRRGSSAEGKHDVLSAVPHTHRDRTGGGCALSKGRHRLRVSVLDTCLNVQLVTQPPTCDRQICSKVLQRSSGGPSMHQDDAWWWGATTGILCLEKTTFRLKLAFRLCGKFRARHAERW